jgi:hypothetical protein
MYFSFLDGSLIYIPPQSVSQSPDGSENEMSTEEALQLKALQPTDDCLDEDTPNDEPVSKKLKRKKRKDDELVNYVKENAEKKEERRTKRHNELLEVQRESITTFKSVMEKLMEKL